MKRLLVAAIFTLAVGMGSQAHAQNSNFTIKYGALLSPADMEEFETTASAESDNGFVGGLRDGFEDFPRAIGSPLYFEDPFINTDLRLLFLHHEFPRDSLMGGGDLTALAIQARLALSDRLQFIATADGHGDLEATNLPEGEGWNDLAAGLKYAFYVDKEKTAIASAGVRWRLSNGSGEIFNGLEDEVSAFVSAARKIGKLHIIGGVTGRKTTHNSKGNDSLSWDINASYELFKNFFPLVEYHGFLYLSNGKRLNAVRDGLLDYGNLGAGEVSGSSANWGTVGFRWNFKDGVSLGSGYGVSLNRSSNNDIFDRRLTMNLIFTF